MATQAPFTAHIRLFPPQLQKRTEQVRELGRLGYLIGEALQSDAALWLAAPGGGQDRNYRYYGDQQPGFAVAVKPAFGETPAQATVVGFYDIGTASTSTSDDAAVHSPTQPDTQVFSGGQVLSGNVNAPWAANPNARVADEVKALKANLEQYLSQGLPASVRFSVFRIDYGGVIWGDRGYHFPH